MFERKKSPPQKRIDSLIGAGTTATSLSPVVCAWTVWCMAR